MISSKRTTPSSGNPPQGLGLVKALLAEKDFQPLQPRNLEEAGLSDSLIDSLICKHLAVVGTETGRAIAEHLCLSPAILEERLQRLSARQILAHKGSAPLGDYFYILSEQGRELTQHLMDACAYRGSAPVPLADYVTSVDAQTITAEAPKREQLENAFRDISVNPSLFSRLGPAVNSGTGLFLYGAPGNGKTTLAERITLCFGHEVWIPKTLLADGEIIKFHDPAYHVPVDNSQRRLLRQDSYDHRWIKIRRPTVVVGGELTMDSLEIRHDNRTNVSEASLQMKSNCGSLLIDDFGRQRMNHLELLNRWIVPLEKRYDYQTLASGKKIQVPFDQLIIFSTNLDPKDLVDEAFLRRIPYKINVPDPDEEEFQNLFKLCAPAIGFVYNRGAVEHLLAKHYRPINRPMRRCHPRDLLLQVHNYCDYNELALEMKPELLDLVVENYFTVVG
ncbi:MAG TPA: ATP-binding protein [Gemmataceae bacterium]|nr:ATP-binding protein [Gemmataceae bacterium]